MTNRIRTRLYASILALGAAALSCGGETGHAAAPSSEPAAGAETAPITEPVLTPEEADAQATERITEDNADAELEALKSELEGG